MFGLRTNASTHETAGVAILRHHAAHPDTALGMPEKRARTVADARTVARWHEYQDAHCIVCGRYLSGTTSANVNCEKFARIEAALFRPGSIDETLAMDLMNTPCDPTIPSTKMITLAKREGLL